MEMCKKKYKHFLGINTYFMSLFFVSMGYIFNNERSP